MALLALVLPPFSLQQQFWIILVPVAVFGLSHGGADPFILKRLVGERRQALCLAMLFYFFSSLIFLGLVWFFPVLALLVFLVLSIWHFGFTDAAYLSSSPRPLLTWLCGSLPVLGPVLGHTEQTSELFAWLIGREMSDVYGVLEIVGPLVAGLWIMGFGVLLYRYLYQPGHQTGARVLMELALVGAALVLLPPLLAFTFYFCFVHSVRHFLSIAENRVGHRELKQVLGFLTRQSAPATLGAILLALLAWGTIVLWTPAPSLLVEGVRVMFWGLAALTLPHGFIVSLWWGRDFRVVPAQ
jgi:Brp/Blh family beta-carotene 15,15'-monooxygenase